MEKKLAAIEGILFSMGTSVTRRQLMEVIPVEVKEACKMAKANPYLPVNEVYAMLGYNTPAYFTRLFKAEFGMTFKEYQDKILKENADNSN